MGEVSTLGEDSWLLRKFSAFEKAFSSWKNSQIFFQFDPDKCKFIGYDTGFDSRSEHFFTDESYGKNVIIFGADMS